MSTADPDPHQRGPAAITPSIGDEITNSTRDKLAIAAVCMQAAVDWLSREDSDKAHTIAHGLAVSTGDVCGIVAANL